MADCIADREWSRVNNEGRISPAGRSMSKTPASNSLARRSQDIADMTMPQKRAALAMNGEDGNGSVAALFHGPIWGEVDQATCTDFLTQQIQRMQQGDMREVEASLYGQSAALGAIFQGMAQRSAAHMGKDIDLAERYMRLALKAQSQCRTTLETLAEIKNPRSVAFVKQANIAHGHQQVNNGDARDNTTPPNELQGDFNVVDTGAEAARIGIDAPAPAVAAVNRPENCRGKVAIQPKRVEGRGQANASRAGKRA